MEKAIYAPAGMKIKNPKMIMEIAAHLEALTLKPIVDPRVRFTG